MNVEARYWSSIIPADIDDTGRFDAYYRHAEKVVESSFLDICRDKYGYAPSLDKIFKSLLTDHMRQITIRTLILEMKVCEKCGELKGDTKSERYHSYAGDFLCNAQYLKELYREYPYMYRLIIQSLEQCINNLLRLMGRFTEDLDGLNKEFFQQNPCKRIVRIGGGHSDSHNGGQKVFIMDLDNGEKLVYKPRSMEIDKTYGDFLQWVCASINLPIWWYRVWDRGNYGWSEWVEAEPCLSYVQLKDYYRRNGVLLCVSYLLGTRDVHYENLIACGEYPVIIDLELGINCGRSVQGEKCTEIERFYQDSVLQTGILPLYTWNEAGEGVNVGAINGEGGQLMPVSVPAVVRGGTTDMHIEYIRPAMKEGKNLALLEGEFIQPYEFLNDIVKGFEDCYRFLAGNKEEAQKRLSNFDGINVRYLVRDTQQYSMLLSTSYHPDFMQLEEKRKQLLTRIDDKCSSNNDITGKWIAEQEVQEMLRGDIPYFWCNASQKRIYSGSGSCMDDFLETPPMESVQNRLLHMGHTDLNRQIKLIETALSLGARGCVSKHNDKTEAESRIQYSSKRCQSESLQNVVNPVKPYRAIDGQGIETAEKIGELLLEEAIWSSDGKEAGWISIIMAGYQERGYLIRPMGFYLYDGLAGIAVFFSLLAGRSGKQIYSDISIKLKEQLFSYTDKLYNRSKENTLPTGAFCGEASVVYAYLLIHFINGDPVSLEYMKKHSEILARYIGEDKNHDILGGNAGAVLVLLNCYKVTKDRQYLLWAKEAGNCLLEEAYEYQWGMGWVNAFAQNALTGFAHGAAGMVLAFSRLGFYTRDYKYYDAAYKAYTFEQHYYDNIRHDWQDLRFSSDIRKSVESTMAWCHGWGGIIASRTIAAGYSVGKLKWELNDSIHLRDWSGEKLDLEKGLCLCHGAFGNAALLSCFDGEKAEQQRAGIMKWLGQYGDNIKSVLKMQESANYGMLSGIAGIGCGCLWKPEEVMKYLMVEIAD